MTLHSNLLVVVGLALAAIGATACQSETQRTDATGAPGLCRPEAANALTGKSRISDAEAMQRTGATIVRQIRPGQGVTMDYRQERVTIETDPKTGKILRAFCG